jgi:hypothetical protein
MLTPQLPARELIRIAITRAGFKPIARTLPLSGYGCDLEPRREARRRGMASKSRRMAHENSRPHDRWVIRTAFGAGVLPLELRYVAYERRRHSASSRADAFQCDCGCGIITIRLLDNGDEPMAEIVFEPGEWLDFFCRLQKFPTSVTTSLPQRR